MTESCFINKPHKGIPCPGALTLCTRAGEGRGGQDVARPGAAEGEPSSAPLVLLPLRSGLLQRGAATRCVLSGNTARDVQKIAGPSSPAKQNFADFSSSPKPKKIN